jgi:hypothetical protein
MDQSSIISSATDATGNRLSLFRASVPARLAMVGVVVGLLWLAVFWAIT